MAVAFLCVFDCSRGWPVTFDAFLLVPYWSTKIFFIVSQLYTDLHEHFNSYILGELFGINLSLFLHKILFKLGPVWYATLNPNFCISFLIFGPIFGIQAKVIVCFFVSVVIFIVGTTRFLFKVIIFCNAFLSCQFSQKISVRYSISAFKYFSEQILIARARNPLNMLVITSGGIQECGLICTFVRVGLRWTSNSYLPLFFFIFISRKF